MLVVTPVFAASLIRHRRLQFGLRFDERFHGRLDVGLRSLLALIHCLNEFQFIVA